MLNSFEQAGLGLALLTLALGLLFTSQIIQRDEQKIYEVIYYMLQGAYLVAALYCVRHAGLALAKKHVAGYVVERGAGAGDVPGGSRRRRGRAVDSLWTACAAAAAAPWIVRGRVAAAPP